MRRRRSRPVAAGIPILLLVALHLACMGPARYRPPQSLELHYRDWGTRQPAVATTQIYRSLIAPTLGSKCRMWPNDSRYFDLVAPGCGPVRATVRAMARLLIERAASPRFLWPVTYRGQLVWFDVPQRVECSQ